MDCLTFTKACLLRNCLASFEYVRKYWSPTAPVAPRKLYGSISRTPHGRKGAEAPKSGLCTMPAKTSEGKISGLNIVLYLQTTVCWFIALSRVRCIRVSVYPWSLQRQTPQDSLERHPGITDTINNCIAAWHLWWRSASETKYTTGRLSSACCWMLAFVPLQVWDWFSMQIHISQTTKYCLWWLGQSL